LCGPAADDETLRSAFPLGRARSERDALSDLRMAGGDAGWGGQGLEVIEFTRQMFL
jgi:hypothetical protein